MPPSPGGDSPRPNVIDRILDQWCELAAIRSPKRKLPASKQPVIESHAGSQTIWPAAVGFPGLFNLSWRQWRPKSKPLAC